MNLSELHEILLHGENSGIEFKLDELWPEQLAREIVAFANFKGGKVLLGVGDNAQVEGIKKKDLEEWVMNVCSDLIHPRIIPFYEELKVSGKIVAIISVDRGISKPYVLRNKGREDIYIRAGSSSRLATREEQLQLFQSGGLLHVEVLPIPRTSYQSLDDRRILDYFRRVRNLKPLPESQKEWEKLLCQMEFMALSPDQKPICTLLGLVLFGRHPRKSLTQAGISWTTFRTAEKNYDALDRATLDGPLVGLWDENNLFLENGLIETCISKLKLQASREELKTGSAHRELSWELPPEVLREGVLNALAHRDWSRPGNVEISLYSDRMEICSPDPLPNHVTLEAMKLGIRVPRNPMLLQILKDYGYVEHLGMGVSKKIISGMLLFNQKEPIFEVNEFQVKLTLLK